jgi:hypothetical protein
MPKRRKEEETVEPLMPRGGVEALRPFLGKWVALSDEGDIVAVGDTFERAADAATANGAKDPGYMFVPLGPFVG